MESRRLGDHCVQRLAIGAELLARHRPGLGEAVAGYIDVGPERLRAVQRLHPLTRVRGPHGGEDAVQEDFAEKQNLLSRKADREVSAGMRTAEEQHVDVLASEL